MENDITNVPGNGNGGHLWTLNYRRKRNAQLNGIEGTRLKSRIDGVVRLFDIGGFAETKIDKLSTGMKQRVAIARTTVHHLPVLILDEPAPDWTCPPRAKSSSFS
jgi:ABC-type Na+ transport system ATPase subunit NatA